MQRYCAKCGNKILPNDKFCGGCGNFLEKSLKIVNKSSSNKKEDKNVIVKKSGNSRKISNEWYNLDLLFVYSCLYLAISSFLLCHGILANNTSRLSEDVYSNLTIWFSIFLILFHCILLVKMFYSKLKMQFYLFNFAFLIEFVLFITISDSANLNFKTVAFLFVLPTWFYFYYNNKKNNNNIAMINKIIVIIILMTMLMPMVI